MRKTIAALAIGATLLTTPALQARTRLNPEQKLAKILEGRVAGEPVSCISYNNTRQTTVIDKTAIVYDAGSVIYVNRPSNAESLDSDDILVSRIYGSQVCDIDTIQLQDRTSHFYSGFVSLNKFVPYRKVATTD